MSAIGRFQKGESIFFAKVVDGEIYPLRGDVFGSPSYEKKPMKLKGVRTLTPVTPSKIIAVGLNYADHARESGKPLPKEPLIWIKATTSLIPDGGKIEVPFPNHRTDFEAELAIVIGRRVRNVTPAAAARYIFGYTAAQDISDRTIQNGESQWTRSKSFDTFTPIGPYVETKVDPNDLTIQLFQNGQLRQNSNTSQLIFDCFQLVSFISTNITLLPGDIIVTGTPSGVGPIVSGDRLEVRIQGLAPLFFDAAGYGALSETARHYAGGLIQHAPALLAFCAPTTNSYRRLVPGYEAPINLVLSQRNRSACVRVPMYSTSPKSKRVEFRCPDPSANPYLAFSAMLQAGLDGILNKIEPPEPIDKDLYDLEPEEAAAVKHVPGSLEDVLDALEEDHAFLTDGGVFTDDVIETWLDYKRTKEVDQIRLRPHPWEFMLYYDL